jgi:hypothetical protein
MQGSIRFIEQDSVLPNMELISELSSATGSARDTRGAGFEEILVLDGDESLQRLVDAAARIGLHAEEAVRLGMERGLVLADLSDLGIDPDLARRRLRGAAVRARPELELTADLANWVRRLGMARPVSAVSVEDGLRLRLADRLLVRGAAEVGRRHLCAEAVQEMVAWERAAALGARTMGEWALRELSLARARS